MRHDEEPDPVVMDAIFTELTRIQGDEDSGEGGDNVNYALPISTPEQLLALLRDAPSGVGQEGLLNHLEVQFPFLKELRSKRKS